VAWEATNNNLRVDPPERQFRRPARTRSKVSGFVTMSPDTSRQVIVFTFLIAATLLAFAVYYF
jgi:hypothetical protein